MRDVEVVARAAVAPDPQPGAAGAVGDRGVTMFELAAAKPRLPPVTSTVPPGLTATELANSVLRRPPKNLAQSRVPVRALYATVP